MTKTRTDSYQHERRLRPRRRPWIEWQQWTGMLMALIVLLNKQPAIVVVTAAATAAFGLGSQTRSTSITTTSWLSSSTRDFSSRPLPNVSFLVNPQQQQQQQQQSKSITSGGANNALFSSATHDQEHDQDTTPPPPVPPPPLPLSNKNSIRFLGRGASAIVRPGCVLVAPLHEASHFLMRAALLVVDVGQEETTTNNNIGNENDDDNDNDAASEGEYFIRAVILDHPTPFTIQEMVPHIFDNNNGNNSTHVLGEQLLFRGGDTGGDAVLMLHSVKDIQSNYAIGTSGVYQGGLQQALKLCQTKQDALQYKFFFNYCQFTETELEQMLAATDSQGDAWMSVEVSPSFILNGEVDRGDAWAFLRNTIMQLGY